MLKAKTRTIYKAIRYYPGENITLKRRLHSIVQSLFLCPVGSSSLNGLLRSWPSRDILWGSTSQATDGRRWSFITGWKQPNSAAYWRPEVPLNIIGSFSPSEFQHHCLSLTSDKQKTNMIQKFQGHTNKLRVDFKTWRLRESKEKKRELNSRDIAWLYQPFQSSAFLRALFTLSWTLSFHNFSYLSPLNKTQGLVLRMLADMAHLGLYNRKLWTTCTKLCKTVYKIRTAGHKFHRSKKDAVLGILIPWSMCWCCSFSYLPPFPSSPVSLNHCFLLSVLSSTNSLGQHTPLFSKQ